MCKNRCPLSGWKFQSGDQKNEIYSKNSNLNMVLDSQMLVTSHGPEILLFLVALEFCPGSKRSGI